MRTAGARSAPVGTPGVSPAVGRVAIVGAGQAGTMVGMALRAAAGSAGVRDIGLCDLRPEAARASMSRGGGHAILRLEETLDADTVILAMPVLEIVRFVDEFGGRFKPGSLVLDTGSAKQAVVQAMRRRIPGSVHAVGGHPMVGTERAGAAGADPAALRGAAFVLTPVRRDRVALARARALVRAMGARPVEMDPLVHDRVMAGTSHLAHVAAFALAAASAEATGEDEAAGAPISPGFRAATRLAASDPVMVSSFLRANAGEVGSAIDRLVVFLDEVRAALGADPGRLEALLARARLAGGPR